ncbi:hypothetical protein JCM3775_000029 [Rhodotorula graminis]|uniref:RRM domain-containing protein n=1 Tax=Rhodotorula graminis (strain WP1) TaxID=578459 RepID=A0A194S2M4_RHOGW|nr:uncharacterized protein RHOBADRAFT_53716 [Rhodotorula graminis WP1]KPV74774.1 hypothetical protein RHOBADRAFT_53716 [Rhodotorula graminis WP1]
MSAPVTDSAPAVEPSTNGTAAAPSTGEHPITQAMQATEHDLGHKVFVGNLPFSVNDDSIKDIFAKVGQVTDAQIIHRGTRSLGYGFVTYTNEADAAAAVSQLDKSEISGRQVNVEVAKPMPAPGAIAARAATKAANFKATRETAKEAQQQQQGGEGVEGVEGEAGVKAKKARKPRKPRGPRQPRADDETEEAGDAPSSTNAVSDAADALAAPRADGDAPARKPRNRKRKGAAAAGALVDGGAEGGAPPALGDAKPAADAPRQPRRRGPPAGAPSSTLIFVGNLNFSVTNESLAAAFAPDCAVKSAVVVVRKFGQSAGRSKGFAFVDFASQEDQERALERFQGKELEGRPMSLKVAIQPEEGAPAAGAAGEGEAKQAADKAAGDAKVDEQSGRTEGDAIIVAS